MNTQKLSSNINFPAALFADKDVCKTTVGKFIGRGLISISLILVSFLLSGCGTSPKAQIFILNTIDREALVQIVEVQNIVVKVDPVSIPDTLDQAPIVTRTGSNTLLADEFHRWSGDFQSDILRTLGENISILLPTKQIVLGHETVLLPVDFLVIINIREFDGILGGVVTLNADWIVAGQNKAKKITSKKSVFQEKMNGIAYQDYVATQSRLLARLSEEIADEIRKQLK
ncbi:MAG: PqiC family protein [gamma proteobacterium symbiont of Taylorina sp.]|nr:PqiC family protein [gamma proteobacterium symbiont of Taylorina sp.]